MTVRDRRWQNRVAGDFVPVNLCRICKLSSGAREKTLWNTYVLQAFLFQYRKQKSGHGSVVGSHPGVLEQG